MIFQYRIKDVSTAEYKKLHPLILWKQMDVALKNLLMSDILIRFCEQIPYVFVVIWCLDVIQISPQQFGVLTAIEMITAALIYIPVANFSDKTERKPFVVITFIFFTIFPVILFFSRTFTALIIAFIIRGLKEFGEPTRKAIILDLCPREAKARAFGLYYFVRDFIVSFAAFFGGWLWKQNPATNFFVATAFGLTGTLLFIFFGKSTYKK
jgi:MFS family permease